MKRLFLLLALVGMIATSCEESGIDKPSAICADNEIKYTTKYGYPIELNEEEGFGGTLMSHTYEGEYGVLTFDNDVKCIPVGAFMDCDTITSIILPESLESIESNAFNSCNALTSITIPESVTTIGDYAFSGCSSLTSVTIGDGVTTIGNDAFKYCSSLTSVTIPDSVTSIGEKAFYDCDSLTSVTIPDSVTSIGDLAFTNCSSLERVYCGATTPPKNSWFAFHYNASGRKIYVPAESVQAYRRADGWMDYASDIVGYF